MPIYEESALPLIGLDTPQADIKPEEAKPAAASWGDLFESAMQDNTLYSLMTDVDQRNQILAQPQVEGYEPSDADLEGYEDEAAEILAWGQSPERVALIKRRIDRERQAHQTLAEGGWAGFASSLAAGVIDPINLIPIGGSAVKSAQAGRRALEAAKAGAKAGVIGGLASEAVLQNTQVTRGIEDILGTVTFGTIFGAAIGGGAGALSAPKMKELQDAFKADLDWARNSPSAQSAGAAAADLRTADDLEIVPAGGVEKLLAAPRGSLVGSPAARLAMSMSTSLRRVAASLVDAQLRIKGNERGIAGAVGGSVETRIKLWDGNLWQGVRSLDDAFVRYRLGRDRKMGDVTRIAARDLAQGAAGKLSRTQFSEEVAKAMRRNDEHAVPEVAEAAKAFRRNVFDPLKQAAIDLGMLPENVSVKTADSYLTRVYDIPKIVSRRNDFEAVLRDWLGSEKKAAQARDPAQLQGWKAKRDAARQTVEEIENGRLIEKAEKAVKDAKAKGEDAITAAKTELHELTMKRNAAQRALKHYDSAVQQELDILNLDDDQFADVARQIVDKIAGLPVGHIYSPVPLTTKFMRERTLNIRDDLIEDFLENDIEKVARIYTHKMAPDVELKRAFGGDDLDLKNAQDDIQRDFARAREAIAKKEGMTDAAREKALRTLDKRMKDDLSDLQDVVARMRGIYAMPKDPSALWVRAGRLARTWNYMRLGGNFAITSLSDAGNIVANHGFSRIAGDYVMPMVRNWKLTKLSADEAALAGTANDIVLGTRANAFAEIFEDYARQSKFESGVQAVASKYGLANALSFWTDYMKRMTAVISQTRTLEAAEKLATGKLPKGEELTRLAQLGIDSPMAYKIAEQFKKHGVVDGRAKWANTEQWTDAEAREAFRAAMVADVDRIIITPGQDKPLWMSKEGWKVVGQFKSFTAVSTGRVLAAGLQRRDAAVLEGAVTLIGMGMLSAYLAAVAAGTQDKLPDDPKWWIAEGVSRSGLTGWLMEANMIGEKTIGLGALSAMGVEQPMKYRQLDLDGLVGGPTWGLVEDTVQIARDVTRTGETELGITDREQKGVSRSTLRRFRRLLPFQNLFYLRRIFNQWEDAVGDKMGLPEKKETKQ